MKYNILLLGITCMLSSCISMLILPSHADTTIITPNEQAKVYLNDTLKGTGKNCKIREKLDANGRQIRLEVDGYKPAYIALLQTKNRGVTLMDLPASAALGAGVWVGAKNIESSSTRTVVRVLGIAGAYYALAAGGLSPAAKRYPKILDLTQVKLFKKLQRQPTDKFVVVANVSADIPKKKLTFRADKRRAKSVQKHIKIDNTIFANALNGTLVDAGYIDTTNSILGNKSNGLFLEAKLVALDWHALLNCASEVSIEMEWTVLDVYGQPLYKQTIHSQSGQFIHGSDIAPITRVILGDAIAHSLLLLLEKTEMQQYLKLENSASVLAKVDSLTIQKPTKTPTALDEAMSACATILVKAEKGEGHGSGLFITQDGYLLTNFHVVVGAKSLEVQTHDGKKYPAKVVRSNQIHDLALLKIEATSEFAFELPSSKNYKVGGDVFAIGTPSSRDLSQTLSKGIISGMRKDDTGADVIQTDVSVNRGNSGGALIDKNAILVGVVNAKLIGVGVEGVGFAIPAKDVLSALKLQY